MTQENGNPQDLRAVQEALLARSATFKRSLHVRHVDAGSDGATESEILALVNPFYDMHRLGFFFTASPRHADILLVSGPVTPQMEGPLRATLEAMPQPRAVIAAGSAACSGVVAPGAVFNGGVDRVIPVDVYVPGDPPNPLMLLHALLLAVDRVGQRLQPADIDRGAS
jgi:formate hydrogenlyase subunit 7